MTQPGSPVATPPGFQIEPVSGPDPFIQQLYQVQTTAPERIESVYLTVDFEDSDPEWIVFALQLWDANGTVLYEQPVPFFTAPDADDFRIVLVWSRLGNDTAQGAPATFSNADAVFAIGWANMRLPDLVLAPSSTVQFLSWSNFETSSGTLPVSDCAVTVTRNAGATSDTTALAFPEPYLIPTTG